MAEVLGDQAWNELYQHSFHMLLLENYEMCLGDVPNGDSKKSPQGAMRNDVLLRGADSIRYNFDSVPR